MVNLFCFMTGLLFGRVAAHRGALYVDAIFGGETENGLGKLRLQFFGAISEISLGGAHVGCVGHRVFAALGKSVYAIGKVPSLYGIQSVIHNIVCI